MKRKNLELEKKELTGLSKATTIDRVRISKVLKANFKNLNINL